MKNHEEAMQQVKDSISDIQSSFITKISNQVIQNMKDIKLLEDRVAKLEASEGFDLEALKTVTPNYNPAIKLAIFAATPITAGAMS